MKRERGYLIAAGAVIIAAASLLLLAAQGCTCAREKTTPGVGEYKSEILSLVNQGELPAALVEANNAISDYPDEPFFYLSRAETNITLALRQLHPPGSMLEITDEANILLEKSLQDLKKCSELAVAAGRTQMEARCYFLKGKTYWLLTKRTEAGKCYKTYITTLQQNKLSAAVTNDFISACILISLFEILEAGGIALEEVEFDKTPECLFPYISLRDTPISPPGDHALTFLKKAEMEILRILSLGEYGTVDRKIDYHFILAKIAQLTADWESACENLAKCLELSADKPAEFSWEIADTLLRAQKFNELVEFATEQLAVKDSGVWYFFRAQGKVGEKDIDGAISDITRAIELSPNPLVYSERGNMYAFKKEYKEAISDYERALELTDNLELRSKYKERIDAFARMLGENEESEESE